MFNVSVATEVGSVISGRHGVRSMRLNEDGLFGESGRIRGMPGLPSFFLVMLLSTVINLAPGIAAARQKIVLYYAPTASGVRLSAADLGQMRDQFASVLGSFGLYRVVSEGEIPERLAPSDVRDFRSCSDSECRVRISRLGSADVSAWLKISGRGGRCVVEGFLSPAWSDKGDKSASHEGGCSGSQVAASAAVVAALLCEKEPGQAAIGTSGGGAVVPAAGSDGSTPAPVAPPAQVAVEPVNKIQMLVQKTGFLTIETKPVGASIEIDGRPVGKSPFQDEVDVGRHRIRVHLDEYYRDATAEVDLEPDGKSLTLQLAPAFGKLEIKSREPGATVTINGNRVGTTPFVSERFLSGTYAVEVSNPGRRPLRRQVVVSDGRTTSETFDLDVLMGVLSVLTRNTDDTPCSGKLFIDNRAVGTTPFKDTVAAGNHVLKAICGDSSASSVVDVPVESRLSVVLRMGDKPSAAVAAAVPASAAPGTVAPQAPVKPTPSTPAAIPEAVTAPTAKVDSVKAAVAAAPVEAAVPAAVSEPEPEVLAEEPEVIAEEGDSFLKTSKPVYKKWWFWTLIGVAAAGVAGGVAAGVLLYDTGTPMASGTITR